MNKIKSERIRLGLTQHQLSELTGIPFRTIQNWETGQRKCPDYVERLVLEKLNDEKIYLIFRDSMDDCCEIIGYIKGTEEDAEAYCNAYNEKLEPWRIPAEYMLIDNLSNK